MFVDKIQLLLHYLFFIGDEIVICFLRSLPDKNYRIKFSSRTNPGLEKSVIKQMWFVFDYHDSTTQ